MGPSVSQEITIFLWCLVCGALTAVVFDLFRIMRKLIFSGDIRTSFEDIAYWVLSSLIIYYFVLRFNSGEIRWYMIIGMALGALFYLLTFSAFFIKGTVGIIRFFIKIFSLLLKILLIPVRFIIKIAGRPFIFVYTVSLRKICVISEKLIINIKNLKNFVTKI